MGFERIDNLVRPLARRLHVDHMARLGIGTTMKLAGAYNRLKHGRNDAARRVWYRDHWASLVGENGGLGRPAVEMKDGWALDTSRTLPHLDRVLDDAEKIIAERAGVRKTAGGAYRSYFQDVWTPADLVAFPSFLDFATSSEVLSVVARHLGSVPVLSTALPSGIRFVESNAAFDDQPGRPHDSQLYHIDYYSLPNVYVLVLMRDTTRAHGPWTFLPRGVSQRVREGLGYWTRRRGYRVSDDDVYSIANRGDAIEFCHPRGSVLFIESSGCFHFGSRESVQPRFQLMLGYHGACRTDFAELVVPQKVYPVGPKDSRLRRMVLQRDWVPERP